MQCWYRRNGNSEPRCRGRVGDECRRAQNKPRVHESRTSVNRADCVAKPTQKMEESREKYEPKESTDHAIPCLDRGMGCPPGCVDGKTKGTTAPKTGKPLALQAQSSVSVRVNEGAQSPESFCERHKSEFGRSSVARCLADSAMVEREEEGARRGGWEVGRGRRKKGRDGLRSSGQGGGRAAREPGWVALGTPSGWGEEPGRFIASGLWT
jgi:hypothetical protein